MSFLAGLTADPAMEWVVPSHLKRFKKVAEYFTNVHVQMYAIILFLLLSFIGFSYLQLFCHLQSFVLSFENSLI